MIKIAVLGYGTVGSGVVEVLDTNQSSIDQKAGQEIRVKYVLDLRDFPGDPVEPVLVHDFETIVNDPEVKIVVEAIDVYKRQGIIHKGVEHHAFYNQRKKYRCDRRIESSNYGQVRQVGKVLHS